MESNFNNREFEHYVKSNADQYRMIPSEKVWKGINATLHTRRKWYAIGLSLLLLLTAVSVTWVMVSYPSSRKLDAGLTNNPSLTQAGTEDQPKVKPSSTNTTPVISFSKYSKETPGPASGSLVSNGTIPVIEAPAIVEENTTPENINAANVAPETTIPERQIIVALDKKEPVVVQLSNNDAPSDVLSTHDNAPVRPDPFRLTLATQQHNDVSYYPLTIESVTNAYRIQKAVKKLTWEVYFVPTVSYRKLSVNKSYSGNVSPFSASNYPFAFSGDVNSMVVHKPDMGLELGVSTGYRLSKALRLIGGFQFNINRYDIKAFAYYGEQATINLNGGNGSNSLTAWTYYRNYNGYKSDWLSNYYFSLSAPVGAELRLFGNKKTYFGIAGTVQPTYIIKDRAFLISTDYKNYVEMPRLIRHVNVNTSVETFISYASRSSKMRIQIGPEVRYQALSSFKNPYPVKENLFDFGMKVGISRNR